MVINLTNQLFESIYSLTIEVPDAPQNCSLTNVTIASLTVHCSTDNATNRYLEQYNLEIYNEENQLVKNVSSSEGAYFQVSDLPPGFSFSLFVYVTNKNGHSNKVRIQANTLVGEPRKLGEFFFSFGCLLIMLANRNFFLLFFF